MNFRPRQFLSRVGLAAVLVGPAAAAPWNLTGNLVIHDPSLIKEGNTWWAFATGRGVGVKYSADGLAWTQGIQLFTTERSWWRTYAPAMTELDCWAADIQKFGDRYWCYYSVSEFGRNNSAIGLVSCTSIAAGDWRDDGFVIGSKSGTDAYNAIDPFLTVDADGQPWLAFGSWFSGIQIVRLDPATMKPMGAISNIAKRNNGIEGPCVVYANGYYYLFVSIDVCCQGVNSTYKIAYGRSTTINGPYVDKAGMSLLTGGGTLLEVGEGRWRGPGGQDVYFDGSKWLLARHAYDTNNNGAPTLRISDLYWDAENWPSFDAPVVSAGPVITAHPESRTLPPGSSVTFSSSATGSNLQYQWKKNGVNIAGATSSILTLNGIQDADAADYTVVVSSTGGQVTSRFARLVVGAPNPGRIVNMSVRSVAGVGGKPLIVGMVVNGGTKQVLVRAIGPRLGLKPFEVPGVLADPKMELFQGNTKIQENDNWAANGVSTMQTAFASVGAFALEDTASKDAAMLAGVSGPQTVHVNAATTGSGVVLVECYDSEGGNEVRLKNVSARASVGTGADILISGFVINGNMPKRVVIRGVGPRLATAFGVKDVLADPKLEIHTRINDNDVIVATNDNWAEGGQGAALETAFAQVGAYSFGSSTLDSALYLTLPAGVYTAHVLGVGNTTGEAVVEVFELD